LVSSIATFFFFFFFSPLPFLFAFFTPFPYVICFFLIFSLLPLLRCSSSLPGFPDGWLVGDWLPVFWGAIVCVRSGTDDFFKNLVNAQ